MSYENMSNLIHLITSFLISYFLQVQPPQPLQIHFNLCDQTSVCTNYQIHFNLHFYLNHFNLHPPNSRLRRFEQQLSLRSFYNSTSTSFIEKFTKIG
ncbi:hypothetical protein GIB67_022520 [Kingdonia uniflora]|uniref:Uncharacterized protein n=1 Tax=Kingdonia uniflora TaxID=39325 RepID=A0A7J7L766_9MAGN|nr:hypothetical protein GIB67_022520 [Kingdonia uniflora]